MHPYHRPQHHRGNDGIVVAVCSVYCYNETDCSVHTYHCNAVSPLPHTQEQVNNDKVQQDMKGKGSHCVLDNGDGTVGYKMDLC